MTTTFDAQSPHLAALGTIVSGLEETEARIRRAEADRMLLLAEALDVAALENERRIAEVPSGSRAELAYRAVRAEIATALRVSERSAERMLDRAHALTRAYPRTFEAFEEGAVSEAHARVIADAGRIIGSGDAPEQVLRRAGYEEAVLEHALVETPTGLRPIAALLAAQFAELSIDERHVEARSGRRVYVVDGDDGMADLVAHLPAVEAYAIHAALTDATRRIARDVPAARGARPATGIDPLPVDPVPVDSASVDSVRGDSGDDDIAEPRTFDEIRADLFSDLLLDRLTRGPDAFSADAPRAAAFGPGAPAGAAAISAGVRVTIPVGLLLDPPERPGADRRVPGEPAPPPAILEGYGPIAAKVARLLAGNASHWDLAREADWRDAAAVPTVDRYRPSEAMRRHLRARDVHCRFPGCRIPAARCDIDHTVDAALGGPTAVDNLAHLCRGHHTLKHHSGWRLRQREGGELEWTSLTGRTRRERAPGRVRFAAAGSDPPPF